jgi:hypothetical protein
MTKQVASSQTDCTTLIPLQIVRLNRLTILLGFIIGYVLHAPFVTTVLFVMVALAAFSDGALASSTASACSRCDRRRIRPPARIRD